MARSNAIVWATAAFMTLAYWPAANAQEATKEKVLAALPQLEALARKVVDDKEAPGLSIGVVFEDEVLYLEGFGVRQVGKTDPVDADTVFQLASFSKPIASTVIAAVVGEGTVSWDSRISDIDPSFRLQDPYASAEVTLRDLFSHRSGLSADAGNDLETIGYSRDEILPRLRYLKPTSSFRSAYAYSNFGMTEGGVAAAKAAGMSWEDLADAKLYKPLGMTSTSSRHADFLTHANRAELHVPIDGAWQPVVKRMPDAQSPAGGVSSNVRDLVNWVRLQLGDGAFDGKQVIGADALAETHLPVIMRGKNPMNRQPSFYGLGWGVDFGEHGIVLAHSGAFSAGAETVVSMIPAEHLGIVVLSNAFPTGVPEGLAATFYDLVFDGRPSQDWIARWGALFKGAFGERVVQEAMAPFAKVPSPPRAALAPAAYTGAYANDYIGNVEISEKDGVLVIALGPDGSVTFPLKHFDGDTFLVYPLAESPTLPAALHFEIGFDQKAAAVVLDIFNDNGQGTVTRVP